MFRSPRSLRLWMFGRTRLAVFIPSGSAGGNVEALWRGSPSNAEVGFGFDVNPPVHPGGARIAGDGASSGKVSRRQRFAGTGAIQPVDSGIQGRGFWNAGGFLDAAVFPFRLPIWKNGGRWWRRLGGPTNLPFRVDGNATFNGVAGGTFSSPTLAGTLVARGLRIHRAGNLADSGEAGALGFACGQHSVLFARAFFAWRNLAAR